MKTSDIKLLDINNVSNVELFYKCVDNEPNKIEECKHEDWVGCIIKEIWYNNELCGFISYDRFDYAYCLSCVYILPKYRRIGIAYAAIRKVLNHLKSETNLVYGFVHKLNTDAIDLYKKLGCKFMSNNKTYVVETPTESLCFMDNNFYEFCLYMR